MNLLAKYVEGDDSDQEEQQKTSKQSSISATTTTTTTTVPTTATHSKPAAATMSSAVSSLFGSFLNKIKINSAPSVDVHVRSCSFPIIEMIDLNVDFGVGGRRERGGSMCVFVNSWIDDDLRCAHYLLFLTSSFSHLLI